MRRDHSCPVEGAQQTTHAMRSNTRPSCFALPVCKASRPLPFGNIAFGTANHTTPHRGGHWWPRGQDHSAGLLPIGPRAPTYHGHGGCHGHAGWAAVLIVCEQPKNGFPCDTRLHRLLVSLLDIHVQVEPPYMRAYEWPRCSSSRLVAHRAPQWCGTESCEGAGIGSGHPGRGTRCLPSPHQATGTVDRAPSKSASTLHVPSPVPSAQVPRAPKQGTPLRGPPHNALAAVGAAGAFWGQRNIAPQQGPHGSTPMYTAPDRTGHMVP